MLAPGFVDLQVNGGGGLMINDRPDVETIRTICAAHAPFGTTALLVDADHRHAEVTDRRPSRPASRRRGERCRASSACISKARICRWRARARMIRR